MNDGTCIAIKSQVTINNNTISSQKVCTKYK